MDLIFTTFKRDQKVKFYKDARQTITVQDPAWNSDFEMPSAPGITETPQMQEFDCRLWWVKSATSLEKSLDGDENLNIRLSYPIGSVRLQVREDGFEWLKESKNFVIKGDRYVKYTDWRGIGMLGEIDRYEIVLKKDQ